MSKQNKMVVVEGNEYRRNLGAMKQYVTAIGFDTDTNKWKFRSKSGKEFTADETAIAKWELVKAVKGKTLTKETKAVGEVKKNKTTCLEAAIATLVKHNVPMTAKELVKAMIADGAFFFKATAKTPWNSVGTRLATYLNTCECECKVKQTERGKYAHAAYVEA